MLSTKLGRLQRSSLRKRKRRRASVSHVHLKKVASCVSLFLLAAVNAEHTKIAAHPTVKFGPCFNLLILIVDVFGVNLLQSMTVKVAHQALEVANLPGVLEVEAQRNEILRWYNSSY
jgi:urease beta subunit